MTRHNIGTVDEFPEGRGTPIRVDGIQLAVFNVDGDFYALPDRCPHKNLPIHKAGHEKFVGKEYREKYDADTPTLGGINDDELVVQCPWHGLELDLCTGRNDKTGQGVGTFDVEVEGEEVYLTM